MPKTKVVQATALILCFLSVPAWAGQLNKCAVAGKVTYQDVPCAEGGGQAVRKPPPYDPEAAQKAREGLEREMAIRQELRRQPSQDRLDTARKNLIEAQKKAMDVTGASSTSEAMLRIKSEKCVNLSKLRRLAEADFRSTQSASSREWVNAARGEYIVNGCTQ